MGIKVNMSDKEASSSAPEALPAGKYAIAITDGKLAECGPESKNPGKPYYNIELTVQGEDKYAGRKVFTNVMCFAGALYSWAQILKASGVTVEKNGDFMVPGFEENELPELDWLIGREYVVRLSKEAEKTDPKSGKTYPERNEVKSWLASTSEVSTPVASGAGKISLLP